MNGTNEQQNQMCNKIEQKKKRSEKKDICKERMKTLK